MAKTQRRQGLTAAQRESKSWEASRQYARGEITAEQYDEAERKYSPDYKSTLHGFSQTYKGKNSGNNDKMQF